MGIFGGSAKKKEDENADFHSDVEEIRRMVENPTNVRMSQVREPEQSQSPVWRQPKEDWSNPAPQLANKWDIEPEPEVIQPATAPLFVKIDRYRNILSDLGSIKTAVGMLRSSFGALNELEKARQQTMGIIQAALEKVDKRLGALDNNLVRPTGFSAQGPQEETGQSHDVENTISDIRGQIQQLRSELQRM